MACCVFAAFLLANLLAPFALLRGRYFGAAAAGNSEIAWRYGDAGNVVESRPSRRVRRGVARGAILALGIAVVTYVLPLGPSTSPVTRDWSPFDALHASWCAPGEGDQSVGLILGSR